MKAIHWEIPDIQFIKKQVLISHCRSSGPGGQNVNKRYHFLSPYLSLARSTQAQIRFNVLEASWVPESVRGHLNDITLHQQNSLGMTSINEFTQVSGEYYIASQSMRSQEGNVSLCLKKIRAKLVDALLLANGRVTKGEEKRLKINRNKDRYK